MTKGIEVQKDNRDFARAMYRVVFAYSLKEDIETEQKRLYDKAYESAKNTLYKRYQIDDSMTQASLLADNSYGRATELKKRIEQLYIKYEKYCAYEIINCDENVYFELIKEHNLKNSFAEAKDDMICDINEYLPKTHKKK